MAHDYPVAPRSDAEIREIAKQWLDRIGIGEAERLDVIACLKREQIWTVFGQRRLFVRVEPDVELPEDGETRYGNGRVTIWLRDSVYRGAERGKVRHRFTLAHELGHAVLHRGAPKARGAAGEEAVRPKFIKPFESAERQANLFAATILINDNAASSMTSATEIANTFGVSLKAAEIYFEELQRQRNRSASAERVAEIAAAFSAPKPVQQHYLEVACPYCDEKTVKPVGIKFLCGTCGAILDRLQDGDPGFG